MKRLWLFLMLPFLLSAEPVASPPPLIVQPYYVKDIYSDQIVRGIPFPVTVFTFRNFDNNRWEESKKFAILHAYERLLSRGVRPTFLIGDKQEGITGQYLSVFQENDCGCFRLGDNILIDTSEPIIKALEILDSKHLYIITDVSDIAKRREETLRADTFDLGLKVHVAVVTNIAELRATLVNWNDQERGVLFINAFDLIGDSGKHARYRYIEQVVTDFNKTHLEVGVYRDAHRSALAIGIDPSVIRDAIISSVRNVPFTPIPTKSSVNVARLGQLNLLDMSAGSFKEAYLYEPIDSR